MDDNGMKTSLFDDLCTGLMQPIESGADVNATASDGETALMLAARQSPEVVEMLRRAGCASAGRDRRRRDRRSRLFRRLPRPVPSAL